MGDTKLAYSMGGHWGRGERERSVVSIWQNSLTCLQTRKSALYLLSIAYRAVK